MDKLLKVAKFGGTSLNDGAQMRKAMAIVNADPDIKYIVVSAPGKQSGEGHKITDLLYSLHDPAKFGMTSEQIVSTIESRFDAIIADLGLSFDYPYREMIRDMAEHSYIDYVASRGEYLCAMILANALNCKFVDAADIICLTDEGWFDEEASMANRELLIGHEGRCVIPGFYGSLPNGDIKTFSRGSSDLSGAIIAALVGADVYENWTDVPGMCVVDPRIVPNTRTIRHLTYKEARELAYRGATVIHEDAMFPLKKKGIPINIRNTNDPQEPGTLIVPDSRAPLRDAGCVVGIAGEKDFTIIQVDKAMMNKEVGFYQRLCGVFDEHEVSIEHLPDGIDTVSIIVANENLKDKLAAVVAGIKEQCATDDITVYLDVALVCVVGHGMRSRPGVAARLFGAVAQDLVNVLTISQPAGELSITIAVENSHYATAINALYNEFFP